MTLFDSEADIQRGRQLVLDGERPASMVDRLRMIAYWKQQRERAEWFGCCGHHEYRDVNGQRVCLHTWQPCQRDELAELLELWGCVNSGKRRGASGEKARER